ncbi:unnamed protein product, partial [Ascophyllum nodosum]
KGKRVAGPRFATKEEAEAGMEAFTTSWEHSKRGKLLKPTETHPVPSSTSAAAATALPAGKSLNSLGALNRVQASQFKRQRLDGSHKTREEYMRTPKLSDREKRSLARGWSKRKVKLRRAQISRFQYWPRGSGIPRKGGGILRHPRSGGQKRNVRLARRFLRVST